MSGSNGTIFRPSGGGGGAANTVIASEIGDGIFAPDSNDGFTSNSSTNPRGLPLGNSRIPKGPVSTHRVVNAVIENRDLPAVSTTGLDGGTVYRIQLDPNYPDADAYAFGDVRLFTDRGAYVSIAASSGENANTTIGGIALSSRLSISGSAAAVFGISCRARKVGFICNINASTGGVRTFVDGVQKDTVTTISSGTSIFGNTRRERIVVSSELDSASDDLHDFRLVVGGTSDVTIYGVIIETGSQSIIVPPGEVYLNDTIIADSTGATFASSDLGFKGGWRTIQQLAAGLTLVSESIPGVTSIAQGLSGTNTVSVQAGAGSSFLNSGVYIAGTTAYIGRVTGVAIDTLTVSPTLPFGVSGAIVNLFTSNPSLPIGTSYALYDRVNFGATSTLPGIDTGPFKTTHGYWYAYGATTSSRPSLVIGTGGFSSIIPYVNLADAVSLALTYEGFFNALEVELAPLGSATNATTTFLSWAIDGTPVRSSTFLINPGYANTKKLLLVNDASNSWHKVDIFLANLAGINTYVYNSAGGVTGALAVQPATATFIPNAVSSTQTALGLYERIYANNLGGSADAARGSTIFAQQNVELANDSGSQRFAYSYYGNAFAFVGTAFSGGSMVLDGVGVTYTRNAFYSSTQGWHNILVQASFMVSGTQGIVAFDYSRPQGEWELKLGFLGYTQAPGGLQIADPAQMTYVGAAVRSTFGFSGAVVSATTNICNVMRARNWAWVQGLAQLTGTSGTAGVFTLPNLSVNTSFMPTTGETGSSQAFSVGYMTVIEAGGVANMFGNRSFSVFVDTAAPSIFRFGSQSGSGIIQAQTWLSAANANALVNVNLSFPTSDTGLGASITQLQIVPLN